MRCTSHVLHFVLSYIDQSKNHQDGVRILTVYLYLNDVEAGGGTNFDELGITVFPKIGRALLWPSVFNDEPNEQDLRTSHQALPVEKGIKYGTYCFDFLLLFNPFSHG
jgi:prolyl 4-hydroxylase